MLDEAQTILVIDDHPLMRKGILQLIALEDSLRLAGEAGDGQRGLELARQLRPDLILLDLNLRGRAAWTRCARSRPPISTRG